MWMGRGCKCGWAGAVILINRYFASLKFSRSGSSFEPSQSLIESLSKRLKTKAHTKKIIVNDWQATRQTHTHLIKEKRQKNFGFMDFSHLYLFQRDQEPLLFFKKSRFLPFSLTQNAHARARHCASELNVRQRWQRLMCVCACARVHTLAGCARTKSSLCLSLALTIWFLKKIRRQFVSEDIGVNISLSH